MLRRDGVRVEKGETEEREERQSSPLGHHFSPINLCSLREPRRSFKKKETLKIHGRLLETQKGQKSSKSLNMWRHPQLGTLKSGRMKHVAQRSEPQVRDCFLNLVETEVGKKSLKSIHCHGGAARGRADLRAAEHRSQTLLLPYLSSA